MKLTIDRGEVPSSGEVAASLRVDAAAVETAFQALHEGHVYVLEPGDPTRLRMANPFSALATPFEVFARGKRYFGNCVWDGMGIVSLLGGSGRLQTSCPDCGEPLVLEVADRRLVRGAGVVHFGVPARHWWDDIIFT